MRIGVVPYLNQNGGGIYQYSLSIIRALADWKTDDELILVNMFGKQTLPSNGHVHWETKTFQPNRKPGGALDGLRKLVGKGPHRDAWRSLREKIRPALNRPRTSIDLNVVRFRPELKEQFQLWNLDFALYAWPTSSSFESGIPFVMAIHDLQHRLHPEFPEVSADGEWNSREYCFRHASRGATFLLADSDVGKEDILQCYGDCGVTADRIKVLPFLPASYLDKHVSDTERERIRATYRLPERYFFYPAQFWPHKNHLRIAQALNVLKEARNSRIEIVFSGSQTGKIRQETFQQVMALSSKLRVDNQVHYVGYVPDQDISAIYAEAAGLVMPTFFGPTNIPILEAWAYGCPVLTSDIRGVREQAGDAAILVDPTSVEALADGMYRLWTDEQLRSVLAERGRQRLARYTPADFRLRLIEILEDAKARVRHDVPRRASV